MLYKFGKTKVEMEAEDFDRDGKTGGREVLKGISNKNIIDLHEKSELGEVLSAQTNDEENNEKMSKVDFISNLNEFHIAPVTAFEYVASAEIISRDSLVLTRRLKRNLTSVNGFRSKQMVEVAVGKRDADIKRGMGNFVQGQKM